MKLACNISHRGAVERLNAVGVRGPRLDYYVDAAAPAHQHPKFVADADVSDRGEFRFMTAWIQRGTACIPLVLFRPFYAN